MDKSELTIRISMCRLCIKTLEEDCKDDPRQPDALEHYKAQLARLEAKMSQNYEDILPKPPDIVINLKPAKLLGSVPNLGE